MRSHWQFFQSCAVTPEFTSLEYSWVCFRLSRHNLILHNSLSPLLYTLYMPKPVSLTFVDLYCHKERILCNSSLFHSENSLRLALVTCRLEVIFMSSRIGWKPSFSDLLHNSVFRRLSKILKCKHLCSALKIHVHIYSCSLTQNKKKPIKSLFSPAPTNPMFFPNVSNSC